jgi:hypothetical protein
MFYYSYRPIYYATLLIYLFSKEFCSYILKINVPLFNKNFRNQKIFDSKTYRTQLTPWSRIIIKRLIVAKLIKKIQAFDRILNFNIFFTRAHHWTSLNKVNDSTVTAQLIVL